MVETTVLQDWIRWNHGPFNEHMSIDRSQGDSIIVGGLDPDVGTEITERNLPHWFQPGAAMFITFRTADSLPKEVLPRWKRELEEWLSIRKLPVCLAESIL